VANLIQTPTHEVNTNSEYSAIIAVALTQCIMRGLLTKQKVIQPSRPHIYTYIFQEPNLI